MNNLLKIMTGVVLLASCGVSLAQCPNNLDAKQMYDCIVEEGAGGTYVAPKTDDTSKTRANNDASITSKDNDKLAQNSMKK